MLVLQDLELGDTPVRLQAVANDVSDDEHRRLTEFLPGAAERARAVSGHWDFFAPSRQIELLLRNQTLFPDYAKGHNKTRLQRAVIARLALAFFRVEDHLPRPIRSLYPDFFARLSRQLGDHSTEQYDDEYFAKDIRYALGLTVPGGALQFDTHSRIGPKLVLREISRTRSAIPAIRYVRARGWGRWYNEHIDLRAMREFTPDGWTLHCARMAETLALNPEVRGIVGAGWFYDPAVAEVSPGLGYIRRTQVNHGALLIRIGSEPRHIENAIYRSAVRKRLYEEGKYQPTCFMCAWPRNALLAWAARLKTDPGIGFANYDTPMLRGDRRVAAPRGAAVATGAMSAISEKPMRHA